MQNNGENGMDLQNYETMHFLERNNWWYVTRRDLLRKILKQTNRRFHNAVDLGCGVGSNSEVLLEFSESVFGLDCEKKAIIYAKDRNESIHFVEGSILDCPFSDKSFDLVVCMDVLEHVKDEDALSEISRILTENGYLFITVPAHMKLWNINDYFSKHHRRYHKANIFNLLRRSFRIVRLEYWNFPMYIPARLFGPLSLRGLKKNGLRNNLTLIPQPFNDLLQKILLLENQIILKTRSYPPTGVSLIALAKK